MPFIGMLVLTFAVWVHLYVKRLRYTIDNRIHPQRLTTHEKGLAIIPEEVHYPANNFRNLCELPVVFYAICLYLFVTDGVDAVYVTAAWLFFALRVVHSVIHCTINRVIWRFSAYAASSLILWFMLARVVVGVFDA